MVRVAGRQGRGRGLALTEGTGRRALWLLHELGSISFFQWLYVKGVDPLRAGVEGGFVGQPVVESEEGSSQRDK